MSNSPNSFNVGDHVQDKDTHGARFSGDIISMVPLQDSHTGEFGMYLIILLDSKYRGFIADRTNRENNYIREIVCHTDNAELYCWREPNKQQENDRFNRG